MAKSPGRTALYRLYDGVGCLLYVGITGNLDARWGQHSVKAKWWSEVVERTVEWHKTRALAEAAERAAIASERPRWNVHHQRPATTVLGGAPSAWDRAQIFKRFKKAREARLALHGTVTETAVEELRKGAAPQKLAELTGLSSEFFRRLAREAGIPPRRSGSRR
jgi:hypothetical protein